MGLQILSHIGVVMIFSPLLLGTIGKTKAFFAGRRGAPLLQPYYDIAKLFQKGNVYSTTTTWIFQAAPIVAMAAVLVSSVLIPLGGLKAPLSFWGDVVLFVYLYALARFLTILAALDTGSSFEGMGASREAAFSCLTEVVLFLNLMILALISKNFVLSQMIEGSALVGPALFLAGSSYFLVLLAENARIPVDDPATHLELTMIHEVMVLDHSGPDFAAILYSASLKFWILGMLIVRLVVPVTLGNPLLDGILFLFAMAALAVLIGIIESVMARLRLTKVPQLLIVAIAFSILALILEVR